MNRITRKQLADAVEDRLATIPNLQHYRGSVPTTPPTISSDDLRVKPYVVLFPGAGMPGSDPRLAGDSNGLGWSFQLTCVSGRQTDVEQLVDVVTNAFELWTLIPNPPLTDGRVVGRCRQINDPGTPVPDKGQTPPRFFTALIYRIPLSA
jgi:hypothetical protein